MTISDQLKQAIRESSLPISELAAQIGVSYGALYRFISDDPDYHRDIRLEATADKIANYFGLRLKHDSGPRKKSARK